MTSPTYSLNQQALLQQGIFAQHCTPPAHILALITAIRPRATSTPLIRVGGDADGGYLVPDDLEGIAECFSPGVGLIASFESDLLKRFGIRAHLADGSVAGPPAGYVPQSFTQKFLGPLDDHGQISLAVWMENQPGFSQGLDYGLQMDIEGAEYAVLLSTPRSHLRRFRWLAIEFHNVVHWCDPAFFRLADAAFRKLLQDFVVVHTHPNNCCGLVNMGGIPAPNVFELTLHRRDRCEDLGPQLQIPNPLDRPNLPEVPVLELPQLWYRP